MCIRDRISLRRDMFEKTQLRAVRDELQSFRYSAVGLSIQMALMPIVKRPAARPIGQQPNLLGIFSRTNHVEPLETGSSFDRVWAVAKSFLHALYHLVCHNKSASRDEHTHILDCPLHAGSERYEHCRTKRSPLQLTSDRIECAHLVLRTS